MAKFSLEEKVVVVTGAAGLLGQHFCQELLTSGAIVVAIDTSRTALEDLRSALGGNRLVSQCADVRERSAIAAIRSDILDRFGRVDGLVNNAAAKSPGFFEPFETFSVSDWEEVMSVNLTGAMICCQEFGSAMTQQRRGSIVNVLSIYGIVAPDQRIYEGSEYLGRQINTPAVYSASKAGLWGLTAYLSSYWGRHGVRVNALSPGGIYSGQNKTFVLQYSHRVPMERMGEPTELCGALTYLLSDASSYVTGQNLLIDGGLSVW